MLNSSSMRLLVLSVVLTWSVFDCQASKYVGSNQQPDALRVQSLREENVRLARSLDRQLALAEQLNARLAQQATCTCETSMESDRLPSPEAAPTTASRLEATLVQVDDRVEIFPGGPLTPISH
jgi:hypothetical protein